MTDLLKILEDILDSDMVQREEDDDYVSPLLARARKAVRNAKIKAGDRVVITHDNVIKIHEDKVVTSDIFQKRIMEAIRECPGDMNISEVIGNLFIAAINAWSVLPPENKQ